MQICEKVPNYPMLKKVKKNSCIQNLILNFFKIESFPETHISDIMCKFDDDRTKTVTCRVYTDRQTNKRKKANEVTYLRFSQVIILGEMAHPVGCHNVAEGVLGVFSSKLSIIVE